MLEARERVRHARRLVPVLLKIAPDLTLPELDDVVGVARKRCVDGMIVGNTTISRPGSLRDHEKAREQGGLVGPADIQARNPNVGAKHSCVPKAHSPWSVSAASIPVQPRSPKIKAGATLVQIYSGLVYRGIGVVNEIKADLTAALKRGHRNSLVSMVGTDAAAITAESWPG